MKTSAQSITQLSNTQGLDDRLMYDLWLGQWLFPSMIAADELGIADILHQQPAAADDIARKLNVNGLGVATLCDLLVCLGFLSKTKDAYSNTQYGNKFLTSASETGWGAIFRPLQAGENARKIVDSIKKGGCHIASDGNTFSEMWEEGAVTEQAAREFIPRMHCLILPTMRKIVSNKLFAMANSVIDVGGGSGALGVALAEAGLQCKYTLFELPAVCTLADEYLKAAKAANYNMHKGSFFTDHWPMGHGVVFLSNILHDWPPSVGMSLIQKAYQATAPGGKIVLQEMIMDEDKTGPLIPVLFSLLMFINHTAQQFTRSELFAMLETVGFVNPEVTEAGAYYSLVTASKPLI
ncbi:MAG: hypothetical protein K2X93_02825 [Candidatus Obscuribacterales bacterium]|nr:hypothetical protein [Candidatus Obscuribacterales bacterium]